MEWPTSTTTKNVGVETGVRRGRFRRRNVKEFAEFGKKNLAIGTFRCAGFLPAFYECPDLFRCIAHISPALILKQWKLYLLLAAPSVLLWGSDGIRFGGADVLDLELEGDAALPSVFLEGEGEVEGASGEFL